MSDMQAIDSDFRDDMRTIIREEVGPIVREEVRPIIREEVAATLHEAVQPLREDIAAIKNILGVHGMQLQSLQSEVGAIKTSVRSQSQGMHRLDVLLEDLNDRFAAARELRWD